MQVWPLWGWGGQAGRIQGCSAVPRKAQPGLGKGVFSSQSCPLKKSQVHLACVSYCARSLAWESWWEVWLGGSRRAAPSGVDEAVASVSYAPSPAAGSRLPRSPRQGTREKINFPIHPACLVVKLWLKFRLFEPIVHIDLTVPTDFLFGMMWTVEF